MKIIKLFAALIIVSALLLASAYSAEISLLSSIKEPDIVKALNKGNCDERSLKLIVDEPNEKVYTFSFGGYRPLIQEYKGYVKMSMYRGVCSGIEFLAVGLPQTSLEIINKYNMTISPTVAYKDPKRGTCVRYSLPLLSNDNYQDPKWKTSELMLETSVTTFCEGTKELLSQIQNK